MANKAALELRCGEIQEQVRQTSSLEVIWGENDPKNPMNWPVWYKIFGIAANSIMPTIVGIYASAYTAGISGIQASFPGTSKTMVLLGGTTYLLGLALGSLLLTSLSEIYGRRPVHILSTGLHSLLVIPAALAPSPSAILASRFFGGFVVSASLSTSPGSVSDLASDKHRALAFSFWSLGAMNGAVIGPIMGGFVFEHMGWRWINWIVGICSGASFFAYCLLKETYAPVILERQRVIQHRTKGASWWMRHVDDGQPYDWDKAKASIIRPLKMAFFEPICLMLNVYAAIFYAILFLCFIGYPVVFEQQRGWSPGIAGLAYCGISVGVTCAVILEPVIRAFLTRYYHDPSGSTLDAYMVPACMGGILVPIGQFWFSWTAPQENIHWIVPILAGVPFGFGNTLVFIYILSYMSGSYGIYTASAVAGATAFRYSFAATLPLAGPKMYDTLGVNWAGTTLGCLELILIPIPFIFYKYGANIRGRSALISSLS